MDGNFKELKQMLDTKIGMETKCFHIISQVLKRENKGAQNAIIRRVACLLERFPNTPPEDILRELEDIP